MPGLQLDMVTWSLIKDLAYCEYMAYLNAVNGRYRLGVKRGSRARVIVQRVLSDAGKRYIAEPIIYTLDGVSFYLRPDAVVLDDEGHRALMILKAYIRKDARVYESDFIPLYMTGYMLGRTGVDVEGSKLVVIASKSEATLIDSVRGFVAGNIWNSSGSTVKYRLYVEEAAIPLVNRIVELARGYRGPTPASTPFKCASCIYREECAYRVV